MSTEETIIRNKLNDSLSRRSVDIKQALDHIETSGQLLDDFLVPSKRLYFSGQDEVSMNFEAPHAGVESMSLHKNAIAHLAGRFGVNARDLQREATGSEWEREVFKNRMNEYAGHSENKNVLVRRVDGKAKAVLSDRYRRLNSAEIFMAFLRAAAEVGSVLVDANHGELRDFMEVIHPEVITIESENNGTIYTALGAQSRNSDFGAGKHELKLYHLNVVCLNGMVSKAMISDVHLGRKLENVGQISFTEETMNADTRATALAVRDIMKSAYSPENLQEHRQKILLSTETEIDIAQQVKALPKMGVSVGEVDLLGKVLMDNNPDDGVQGRNTMWKFAQGLTAVANQAESADRKRDLQDIASTMFNEFSSKPKVKI